MEELIKSPVIIAAFITLVPILIGGASGWVVAILKAKSDHEITAAATEPAMQIAISSAVTNIITTYKDELKDVKTEFKAFRAEVHQYINVQNDYIDKLIEIMRKANLEVPERPRFAYARL